MPSHLRRALGLLAYGAEQIFDYTGDERMSMSAADDEIPPLDEVDATLIGQFRVSSCARFVERLSLTVLVAALTMLDPTKTERDAPDWAQRIRRDHMKEKKTRRIRIGDRYRQHIRHLSRPEHEPKNSGPPRGVILKVVNYGVSWFCSGYFAVLKTVDTARSIFSGKRLSKASPVAPPVNLADTRDIVKKINQFARRRRKNGRTRLYVYGGDFRHWFHQIPASPWMRCLFGLVSACGTEFQWQTLPMGWSWSPHLAQACAWCALIFTTKKENVFDLDAFRSTRLPTWIEIRNSRGEVTGIATVYYDNFLIITDNANDMDRARAQVRNACQTLHAVVKDGSEFFCDPSRMLSEGFTYLGIHFQCFCDQESSAISGAEGLRWKPGKIDQWKKKQSTLPKKRTARHIAQLAGNCIFALLMSPHGLHTPGYGRRLIEVTRAVGRHIHGDQQRWDAEWTDDQVGRNLDEVWRYVMNLEENPHECRFDRELEPELREPSREWIVATDASSTGLGWCWFRAGEDAPLSAHRCGGRQVTDAEHIFFLELRAVLEGMHAWCQIPEHEGKMATVIVDNAAFAFALRHGFSSNAKATEMMDRARPLLARVEDVVLVISEDNPSDCCSRLFDPRKTTSHHDDWSKRVENMWKCIACRERGWNWASQKAREFTRSAECKGGLRHRETNEDADFFFADEAGICDELTALDLA